MEPPSGSDLENASMGEHSAWRRPGRWAGGRGAGGGGQGPGRLPDRCGCVPIVALGGNLESGGWGTESAGAGALVLANEEP